MRFIDLFAGVGGFHYGLQQCDRDRRKTEKSGKNEGNAASSTVIQRERELSFSCVYSNEWDKYANSVYRKHFGQCDNRDIRTVDAGEIPDHDLLCGGFPCQSFSIAGKRGGFNDTRGTLFFDIARILKEKQPRLCLLENVKGLLSHDNGRTFKTIIATLTELGYDTQWQVLNSKNFGVPQNRERVFIIGHLRGTRRPQVFPIGESGKKPDESYAQRNDIAHTVTNSDKHRGSYVKSDLLQGVSNKGASIRRLTPIECERLQGFPDNWTQYGADGEEISDTQRYKMCGNAVTTNVISAIAERLNEPT